MLVTIIVFILTLLVLVLSHEFGHFFMAKKFGVKVLEFGFGIPPRAWGKKIGETIYSINWLPIGGFVKLLGEDEEDQEVLDDLRSFAKKNVWKRIVIVVAGVSMNLFLAWLLFYVILIAQNFRIIYPTQKPVVMVTDVEKGSAAQAAGIKSDEQIIALDGKNVSGIYDAISYIKSRPNQKVEVTLQNLTDSKEITLTVVPKEYEKGKGRIGVGLSPLAFKEYKTLPEKLFSGVTYSFDLIKLNFQGLGNLAGDVGKGNFNKASEQVAGPVGMVEITNNILSIGGIQVILPYLWFMAILSLTLATINILPVPALDGGRLFFLLIEAVSRKKVRADVERMVHTVGMALLLGLIVLITYSDIRKFF